jgi:hypothetical protein
MSLPISQTHPTEVMLAAVALHVITTSILFNADVALGALQSRAYN